MGRQRRSDVAGLGKRGRFHSPVGSSNREGQFADRCAAVAAGLHIAVLIDAAMGERGELREPFVGAGFVIQVSPSGSERLGGGQRMGKDDLYQ